MTERIAPDIGGVAASAGRIARTLGDIGHDLHVVALSGTLPGGMVDKRDIADGVSVHRLGQFKNLDFTLQQASNLLDWLHDRNSFDLVWAHYLGPAGFLATWFAEHSGIPSYLSLRGNDLDRSLFPPGDFGRLRWCLERATRIVTVSRDLASKVKTLVDREADVLPNSVDLDTFSPGPASSELRNRYELEDDELVIGFNGEVRAKKGVQFLVQALREMVPRRPTRLFVLGEVRAKDRAAYERSIAGPDQLDQYVTVTGHIEQPAKVAEHLRLMDVLLMPSLWDGMPNALLEAMAVGVPVIASDAGGIPEIVRHGENGILIPKTHLHCLADQIEQLFSMSGDSRDRMIQAAIGTVRENHSPKLERDRIRALLKRLASNSS